MTSLFLDVVGSTDLMMRIPPERMKRLLDGAFTDLSRVIVEHGGTVEKFIGDAIFAVFGVPTAHADDALRAVAAAEACAAWADAHAGDQAALAIRIGVESGHVLADLDAIEGRERMIVGPSVNFAARLQAAADPGQILVGPVCHDATVHLALFDDAGELELKGIGKAPAWLLVAASGGMPATDPSFVGRRAELALLQDALGQARAGQSLLALVIGPPGQGKSRLVRTFVDGQTGARTLAARCRPEAEQGALTPLRQLLAAGAAGPDADTLLRHLSELFSNAEERDRVGAALMHSAGIPGAAQPMPTNPVELQDEVLNGWRRYLAALTAQGPVMIWIDDLHWAEPELVRLLDRLTTRSEAPLLVIGTARPELVGHAALRPGNRRILIELDALTAEQAEQLALDAGVTDRSSIDRAAGNPLFILELARSRRSADDEIPVTLHAAIAARIDELSREDREMLQRSSVAGETFTLRDATMLAGREAGAISGALGRLTHAGYVTTTHDGYRFHHPLVHDVAYGRLSLAERMHLHARYAQEGVDPEDVEALAHHWWRAVGEPDAEWVWDDAAERARLRREAFQAHVEAGRRNSGRFALERAVEVLERALQLAEEPQDVAVVERELGRAYARDAQGDAAWEHRMRALAALHGASIVPPGELYTETVTIPVFNYGFTRTMPDEAVVAQVLTEGLEAARTSGDEASLATLLVCEGFYTGDATKAATARALVERAPDPLPYADTMVRLGVVQLVAGDVDASDETFRRVEDLIAAGARVDELEFLAYRPTSHLLMGRIGEAADVADRFMRLSETMGAHLRTHALQARSSPALVEGEWDLVLRLGLEAAAIVEANQTLPYCIRGTTAVTQGAVAALMEGDRATAESLLEVAGRMMQPGVLLTYARFLPSVMLGERPDPGEALPHPGSIIRPWQRQLVDPGHLSLAAGVAISGRHDARPRVLEHLALFGGNGSPMTRALAQALDGEVHRLHALGCGGLVDLLSFGYASSARTGSERAAARTRDAG